ncbi:MAG: alpha/beta hydrolase family esterase [Microthrixaceae bacterium]
MSGPADSPFGLGGPEPAPAPPPAPGRPNRTVLWVLAGTVGLLAVAVLALVAVLVLRDGGDGGRASAGAASTTAAESTTTTAAGGGAIRPGGQVQGAVRVEERYVQQGVLQRPYLVISPADAGAERLPAVMVLHGLTFNRNSMSTVADWRSAVARDRFVAVFPQGVLDSWNAGPCCPPSNLANTDDVGYLTTVAEEVGRRTDVDPSRRFLTGFSNGGIMTYTMACARPTLFAAVAPMAGSNVSGCAPPTPVSLLHAHGDPDPTVPYDGSLTASRVLSSAPFPDVPTSVAAWAAADKCAAQPTVTPGPPGVTTRTWNGCADGARVELVTYPGNGHNWPTQPVEGIDLVLRFFGIRTS